MHQNADLRLFALSVARIVSTKFHMLYNTLQTFLMTPFHLFGTTCVSLNLPRRDIEVYFIANRQAAPRDPPTGFHRTVVEKREAKPPKKNRYPCCSCTRFFKCRQSRCGHDLLGRLERICLWYGVRFFGLSMAHQKKDSLTWWLGR